MLSSTTLYLNLLRRYRHQIHLFVVLVLVCIKRVEVKKSKVTGLLQAPEAMRNGEVVRADARRRVVKGWKRRKFVPKWCKRLETRQRHNKTCRHWWEGDALVLSRRSIARPMDNVSQMRPASS